MDPYHYYIIIPLACVLLSIMISVLVVLKLETFAQFVVRLYATPNETRQFKTAHELRAKRKQIKAERAHNNKLKLLGFKK